MPARFVGRSAYPAAVRSTPSGTAAAVWAAVFVLLAGLVAAGITNPLDQWALDHVMPGADPTGEFELTVSSVLQPYRAGDGALTNAINAWLYPASVPISALVVGAACWALARRGLRQEAVLWASAWVMGNLIEGVGKTLIDRPLLFADAAGGRLRVDGYESSFPSGHTIRGVILAAAVAYVWRRARWAALAWLCSDLVLLVVGGDHVPTDVLGGLLVALLLVGPLYARRRAEPPPA